MNTATARKILVNTVSSIPSLSDFNANTANLEYLSSNGNLGLYYAYSNNVSYTGLVSHFLRSKSLNKEGNADSGHSLPQTETGNHPEKEKNIIHLLFSIIDDCKLGHISRLNDSQVEELRSGVPASEVLRKSILGDSDF